MVKSLARNRFAAAACALMLAAPLALAGAAAQQAAPASPSAPQAAPAPAAPAATPPAAPSTPAAPSAAAPSATAPPTSPPAAPGGAAPADSGQPSDETSTGQTLVMAAHPAAYIEGKANWSEGFGALTGAIRQIKAELAKDGIAIAGHPLGVFVATDDTGFSYRAMVPIDKAPEGKTSLSDIIKLGETPTGKAMKFEHRGSYEDIDSTYEAITAYLDEKGLEADNLFVEEYLNEVKTPDDPNLQVDIYVLLK